MTDVISTTIDTHWAVTVPSGLQVLGHFRTPEGAAAWREALGLMAPDSPRHYRIVKVTTTTTVEAVNA